MALQKSITAGIAEAPTVNDTYHQISNLSMDPVTKEVSCTVLSYTSAADKQAGAIPSPAQHSFSNVTWPLATFNAAEAAVVPSGVVTYQDFLAVEAQVLIGTAYVLLMQMPDLAGAVLVADV